MKNRQRQKDGFTLVETVVAMFILSIIAAAYVGLFTTSYGGIFSAGRKSEAIYSAQKDADEKFISGAANNAESIDIILTNTEDSSVESNLKINGEIHESEGAYENKKVIIYSFIPFITTN